MRKKTKRLLEENNQAEAALNEQGKKLLTDIVVYLRGSRITTWEQEQVRRDITQMLLDAQARGEQAEAVIAARSKIVDGAVSMVKMAIDKLGDEEIVVLDEERKAAMVSNLMVVLCSGKDTQPIVNSGSIY